MVIAMSNDPTTQQESHVASAALGVPLIRREFLYYLWGISMAVFLAGSGGATIWFALPRFRAGEFGGSFLLPLSELPAPDTAAPVDHPEGRFWLVNAGPRIAGDRRTPPGYVTGLGMLALYKVCVHLGCIYKWTPASTRFECPCHGSKYLLNGVRLSGPARRNLDRFLLQAVAADGTVLARTKVGDANRDPAAGLPLLVPKEAVALVVDTSQRIFGEHSPK